ERLHVHSPDNEALGAIEPVEPLVGRRVGRRAHEWRPGIEFAAQGAGVAVAAKLEVAAVGRVDARARRRFDAPLNIDDRDAVGADAHPVSAARQEAPFEHRSGETRLLEMPVDPEPVRYGADDVLAKLDRRSP